jgi:hypothetical protein
VGQRTLEQFVVAEQLSVGTVDGVPEFFCAFPRRAADRAPGRCGSAADLLASIRSGVADFDPNLFRTMANVVNS